MASRDRKRRPGHNRKINGTRNRVSAGITSTGTLGHIHISKSSAFTLSSSPAFEFVKEIEPQEERHRKSLTPPSLAGGGRGRGAVDEVFR
jgi:hypothetical protein